MVIALGHAADLPKCRKYFMANEEWPQKGTKDAKRNMRKDKQEETKVTEENQFG
jgi:hypothetical protein